MDLKQLIDHPELMDRDTLYELRSLLAVYPYHQTARLLLLQNLYILHDSAFDEELRKAAIYITDRSVVFNMVESVHYRLRRQGDAVPVKKQEQSGEESRTLSLIDNFLDSLPEEEEPVKKTKRKPTPADAAVDYVAYLMQVDDVESEEHKEDTPQLKGQSLIDDFIFKNGGRIELKDDLEYTPSEESKTITDVTPEDDQDEGYFTETLAKIYIKQGRYEKALEIIKRLNLNYPKKNAYFADQIRFLEKLIINNTLNKREK